MKIRAARIVFLATVLAVPAGAFAGTPCDLLPTTNKKEVTPAKTGEALCNACVGLPVAGSRDRFGNGLDYNDGAKHWECEMMVGNRGNGQCKRQTTCLPGGERFDDHGVFRCRYPAVVVTVPGLPPNPRDACERDLPLTITALHDDRDQSFPTLYPGTHYLFVRGPGAANATSGEMTGDIGVTVGEAARRLGANAVCLPPDCQDVKLVVPSSAAGPGLGTSQTLKLFTPHRYRTATMTLSVRFPPTPAPMSLANQGAGRVMIGAPGSGPTPTPTRTPTPRPATQQQYSAGLSCPGSPSQFQNVATPEFEIRSAQAQATVTAHWLNSKNADGSPKCTQSADFQYQMVIKSLTQGQSDVIVSWQPQPSNNYANPLDYSSVQTISLPQGRWKIAPDATFPSDFSYTISFRD